MTNSANYSVAARLLSFVAKGVAQHTHNQDLALYPVPTIACVPDTAKFWALFHSFAFAFEYANCYLLADEQQEPLYGTAGEIQDILEEMRDRGFKMNSKTTEEEVLTFVSDFYNTVVHAA